MVLKSDFENAKIVLSVMKFSAGIQVSTLEFGRAGVYPSSKEYILSIYFLLLLI